ncbi:alcohol dehydrogenase (NADP+) [Microdochium nivale]|nr:alcohol dehydrogenase (NADP+) [Microdochium nivale]
MTTPKLTINSTLPLVRSSAPPVMAGSLSSCESQNRIPILGLGVYRIKPSQTAPASPELSLCHAACQAAFEAGYRHIDTARLYRNELQVSEAVVAFIPAPDNGKALRRVFNREDVFLTTKIRESTGDTERDYHAALKCVERLAGSLQTQTAAKTLDLEGSVQDDQQYDAEPSAKKRRISQRAGPRDQTHPDISTSVARSGPSYVDLLLIHQPPATLRDRQSLWSALVRLQSEGRARNIGVSNYRVEHLEEMRTGYAGQAPSSWPPCVNQIEAHPWFPQAELARYCAAHGIVVEAFAPLAQGRRFSAEDDDENDAAEEKGNGGPGEGNILRRMARKHGKTQAQVLIRWSLQKGFVAIPKSSKPERIRENADVFGFALDREDMLMLDGLDMEGTAGATYKWNKT